MKKIKLTQGKFALIDDEDFERLFHWKWTYANTGYAKRQSMGKTYLMHRQILNINRKYLTDHINYNKLDNRKKNLRVCNPSQNLHHRMNKKGYTWSKKSKKWQAQISIKGKMIYLGLYDNKKDAINTYQQASRKYLGKFSPYQ